MSYTLNVTGRGYGWGSCEERRFELRAYLLIGMGFGRHKSVWCTKTELRGILTAKLVLAIGSCGKHRQGSDKLDEVDILRAVSIEDMDKSI